MKKISLAEIEKGNYLTHSEDGVVDIVAGTGLFLVGLLDFLGLDMSSFVLFIYFPLFLLGPALKKAVTYQRIGYVSFRGTQERLNKGILIAAILVISLLAIGFALSRGFRLNIEGAQFWIIATIVIGLLVAALASFSQQVGVNAGVAKKYLVYAALFIAAILTIPYAGLPRNLGLAPLGLLGLGMVIYGAYCMKKFMEKYPVLEKTKRN